MILRYFGHFIILAAGCLFHLPTVYSQCPQFPTSSIAGAAGTLCEGASVTVSATALNIPPGSFLDWYIGSNSTYSPYIGQGTFIGSVPIEMTCNNAPEVLYIMVNPDNTQVGSNNDKCDEFMVLWTGSGGFSTTDISVTNLGNGTFFWNDFVAGNAASFSCGTSLPPGPVPPNAILIIQGSPTNNVFVNIDDLCASGLPVYIIADNNFDCTGGFFDNNSPCSSCPVMINIGGSCPANMNIDYMPPVVTTDGWGWSNMGSGVFADVVPPVNIPVYDPDETIVDDFTWTIPNDFCETMGGGNWFITGVLQPPPSGSCPDIFTQYFLLDISCPQMNLSGGGDVCVGNCPANPTEIIFDILGNDVPFLADIVVSISIFPDLNINDLQITNGQKIFVCMGGFFPSFNPATGILQVPEFAVGVTATVHVVSVVSASGCPVVLDPDFITLHFIDAASADAGNDVIICSGDNVMLDGQIGGSATIAQWSTNGDGSFLDPAILNTIYTPGPLDIINGSVTLTLISMDPNGSCTPGESNITISINPLIMIDPGPSQMICDNDVVNISVTMTGGNVDGEWITNGDGVFDNPFNQTAIYTPGPADLNIGFVIISFHVSDPNACIGSNNPLTVTIVAAPQVIIPQNLEICQNENITIQITINGSYTNVVWSALGDGQLIIISNLLVNYTPGPLDINQELAILSLTVTSSFNECGQTTYDIPVTITPCNCPDFETSPPSSPLCAVADILDLSTLLVSGGVGEWSISSMPSGSNPAVIVGNNLMTNSSDPGIYTVTYTLDNPIPGCPFSSSEMVVVVGVIVPDAGADIINCGPGAMAILGMPAPSAPVSVLWETSGDGSFADPFLPSTIYTPGTSDSISSGLNLIYRVIDPVCGNQADTLQVYFNEPPFAFFSNDTFIICNETSKGSIINFISLITNGDITGIWSNTGGAPVDFSNPASVDFDGVAEGRYAFTYQTNSAIAPCMDVSYTIIISVRDCLCPIINVQSLPGGICNSQQDLELNAFIMAGAPGTWQTLITPPGNNPAMVTGSVLQIQGTDPGIYRLRFTFDSAPIVACPDSAEINILIQDQPILIIPADISICDIVSVPINVIIGGSAIDVSWTSSGSGSFNIPNGINVNYMPSAFDLASGQVHLIAQTIDTLGFCAPDLDTMLLNLVSPAFATWTSLKDTICNDSINGSVINLMSFISGGDFSGLWSDQDGSFVDLSNPSMVNFDGVNPGIYHFTYLTQSAVFPCTNIPYSFEVLVEDCTCPALDILHSDILSCQGDQLDLGALLIVNVAPGAWIISDGPSGTWPQINGNDVNTNNAVSGNYNLTYTLSDSIPGCPASDGVILTIEEAPTLSIASKVCDPSLLEYSVTITTNAAAINSDFGVVTIIGAGQYKIDHIPADRDILIEAQSSPIVCLTYLTVSHPNCACTLMIENLADTIFLCRGDTVKLIPFVTGATGFPFNYWIDGNTIVQRPSFSIFKDGTFIWLVKDSLCEMRDTFNVKLYDSLMLDADFLPPFCPGGNDGMMVIKDISQGKEPYSLQFDNQQPFLIQFFPDTLSPISSGEHTLFITDLSGCETQFVISIPDPSDRILSLGPDRVIDQEDSVLITPELLNISVASFSWSPDLFGIGLLPKWVSPDETILLKLTVMDSSGCQFQDELEIRVKVVRKFYIPSIFSPNGDQINDIFQVETSSNHVDFRSLEIFDRWGNQVFSQHDTPSFNWDGTYKSKPAMNGVYVVKLMWKDENGNDRFYISDLTLIR